MDPLIILIASTLSTAALSFIKVFIDKRKSENEDKELKDDVGNVLSQFLQTSEKSKDNVLTLMMKNVAELREYYIINKQQARNSFSAALFISILGFIIFGAGVGISYYNDGESVIQYTTIGGAIVEVIAGLFFWLYSKAIKQINLFHTSLLGTQKFLTAIELVDKIGEDNRDNIYVYIIKKIIDKNEDIDINLNGEKEKNTTQHYRI